MTRHSLTHLAVLASCLLSMPPAGGASLPFAGLDDLCGPYEGTGARGDAFYVCRLGMAGGWPICACWSSKRLERSPLFGPGWSIPALESRFVPLDERRWAFYQPDGYVRIFVKVSRDNANVLTGGPAWTAVMKEDIIRVTANPNDGGPKSDFVFRQGRLVRMACEEGDFEIKYAGRQADRIVSRGRTLLEVVREPADERIVLRFNGGRAQVTATCRPTTVFGAQDGSAAALAVQERCLASLAMPDGRTLAFAYGGERDAAFFEADGKRWTWDPHTRKILSCDGWRYSIGDPENEESEPSFARSHADGRQEYHAYDRKNGLRVQRFADGSSSERKVFTSGPLAWRRARWTKDTTADGTCTRMDYTYDEAGRVAYRRMTRDGAPPGIEEVWFGEKGKVIRRRINGEETPPE